MTDDGAVTPGLLDDARAILARGVPLSLIGQCLWCDGHALSNGWRTHAEGCPWPAMPRIVAALEAVLGDRGQGAADASPVPSAEQPAEPIAAGRATSSEPPMTPTRRPFAGEALPTMLAYMQRYGSSVVLTYGEDTGLWECAWITGGDRFTRVCESPTRAAREVIDTVEKIQMYGDRQQIAAGRATSAETEAR